MPDDPVPDAPATPDPPVISPEPIDPEIAAQIDWLAAYDEFWATRTFPPGTSKPDPPQPGASNWWAWFWECWRVAFQCSAPVPPPWVVPAPPPPAP